MKNIKRDYKMHIIMAILFVLCMGTALFAISNRINQISKDTCFNNLESDSKQLAQQILQTIHNHEMILDDRALHFSQVDDLEGDMAKQFLTEFEPLDAMTQIQLLFPDGRMMFGDGSYIDVSDQISYTDEMSKGFHISKRLTNPNNPQQHVIYLFTPIEVDGQVEAILCGMIDLEKASEQYTLDTYFDEARLMIVEGQSKDFLVDNIHEELGNGNYIGERNFKDGYTAEGFISDLENQRAGMVAFYSETYKEYVYGNYEPVGINDWMILYVVPETVAFADSTTIIRLLGLLAVIEAALIILYCVWLLYGVRRDNREKQEALKRGQFMLEIEGLLFRATRNQVLIEEALQNINSKIDANRVFFMYRSKEVSGKIYRWSTPIDDVNKENDEILADRLLALGLRLLEDERIFCDKEEVAKLCAMKDLHPEFRNILIVPVQNEDHRTVGVLGAGNVNNADEAEEWLRLVSVSFAMTARNQETFHVIEKMSMIDPLTGVQNRYCYHNRLTQMEKQQVKDVVCAYIDVDGLHDLNNQCGHDEGDKMLRTVANLLTEYFNSKMVFRIGGDEFVVLIEDVSLEESRDRLEEIQAILKEKTYNISIGIVEREEAETTYEMIQVAEERMYGAKRKYYESLDRTEHMRSRNQQLEEIMREKQDLEVFRATIASQYRGAYIVDALQDAVRPIYMPADFKNILESVDGKYSLAIQKYAETRVKEDYREEILKNLDLERLEEVLEQDCVRIYYEKISGTRVFLKIEKSPNYSEFVKEFLWTFENV